MSAIYVSLDHCAALVNLGSLFEINGIDVDGTYWPLRLDDPNDRSRVGLELVNENVRSVNHRYSDGMALYESFPAFKDFPYGRGDHAQRSRDVVELARWLKWISFYDYQSSEHPDWSKSFASAFIDTLQRRIIAVLCHKLGAQHVGEYAGQLLNTSPPASVPPSVSPSVANK